MENIFKNKEKWKIHRNFFFKHEKYSDCNWRITRVSPELIFLPSDGFL